MQLGKLDVSQPAQELGCKTALLSPQSDQCVTARKQNRAYRADLTAERLREVLDYDPLTGDFRWLVASNSHVHIGKIAGSINGSGYILIGVDGTKYRAHRLAFLYTMGKFPKSEVDHADGDTTNNRWANLREASRSLNAANTRRPRTNGSGFKGVHWHSRNKKWRAQVKLNGRHICLGDFACPKEAHTAYMAAAVKHFGEFASDGERVRNASA
jgi:hypothetical protein